MTPPLIQIQLIFVFFANVFAELPDNLLPVEYKLKIITNLGHEGDSFNFEGSVSIYILCIFSTDTITLHSKNLKIDEEKTALRSLNQTEDIPVISGTSLDPENDFLILTLSKTLQADYHYEVELHFEGALGEEKVGYFRTSYVDKEKKQKWVGVTYFKPDNARRAFPCFDELSFKAKFTISLGRPTDLNSLSNMPLLKTEDMEDKPDWEWDHFDTTPPMSTYNVGFIVCDFVSITLEDQRDKAPTVTRWARENFISVELRYKYPLPKMDIVVMPGYPVPTMQCWGLVIWDEEYMVKNHKLFSHFNLEFIKVVANQMVRQWFGNLVTIRTWADAWFVEGFSKFLEESFVKHEDREVNEEIIESFISVFHFDSSHNSQAVSSPSNQSGSISTFADDRRNAKTCLLIRMLSRIVGTKILHEVICEYLKMYEYNNAGSAELLELVNRKSVSGNIDLKTVMKAWFSQVGFPLITVTRDYKTATLEVKQERFFRDKELLATDTTKWWIPLTYTSECELNFDNTIPNKWLSQDKDSITLHSPLSPADWVIFNVDASALYIVNYDEENWNLIVDFLNTPSFDRIPALNRVILIDNAATLAWVGRLDYKIFLDMLKYMVREESWLPQYVALRRIYDLSAILNRTPMHGRFLNYVGKILPETSRQRHRLYEEYDSEKGESQLGKFHQRSGFLSYIPLVEIRHAILCPDDAREEHPWSDYIEYINNERIRSKMLLCLSCIKNLALLKEYLKGTLAEETLKSDQITPVITAIARNPIGVDAVKEFLSENIKAVHDRISPNIVQLPPVITEIARHITKEDEVTWLKNLIDNNQELFLDIRSRVDESLEVAQLNVQWHRENYETIETYLDESYDD